MKKELFGFNLMKDFACLWVIMVHLEQRIAFPQMIATFMQNGSSGVNIFFILSGFGCFMSLDKVKEKKESIGSWLKRRLFRLAPAYYTVLLLYFILYQLILQEIPKDEYHLGWFRYLFCMNQSVPTKEMFWSNLGATWTVSAFILFYMIAPFLHKIMNNIKAAYVCFVFFYIVGKLCSVYSSWFEIIGYLYYFSLGIIIYFAMREKKEKEVLQISAVGVILLLIYNSAGGLKISLGFVILLLATSEMQWKNVIFLKMEKWFHKYTYTVYLVHVLVLTVIDELTNLTGIRILPMFVLGTCGLTYIVYHFIEQPIQRCFIKNRELLG